MKGSIYMLSAVNLVSQNSNSINFQRAKWGYAKIADNISSVKLYSVKSKKRTVSRNILIIKPLNFKEIIKFLLDF